ncbi:MAG: DUF4278 domain-containing protein [Cyanobacteriota bacterium]|nr:DUF4278 domain-containing protein [Cyanobacteriota bacterium]
MKLTYRGVTYDYNPPAVAAQNAQSVEKAGKYRGIDVRFRNRKKPLVLQPTLDLKYRGVSYHPDRSVKPTAAPALSVADKARSLMMAATKEGDRRQRSMLTRLAAEVGVNPAS